MSSQFEEMLKKPKLDETFTEEEIQQLGKEVVARMQLQMLKHQLDVLKQLRQLTLVAPNKAVALAGFDLTLLELNKLQKTLTERL